MKLWIASDDLKPRSSPITASTSFFPSPPGHHLHQRNLQADDRWWSRLSPFHFASRPNSIEKASGTGYCYHLRWLAVANSPDFSGFTQKLLFNCENEISWGFLHPLTLPSLYFVQISISAHQSGAPLHPKSALYSDLILPLAIVCLIRWMGTPFELGNSERSTNLYLN